MVVLRAELFEERHRLGERLHALHRASGVECVTVPGGHEWVLADPKSFVEVLTNSVGLPERPEELLSG